MSSTLCWRPLLDGQSLPCELKHALEKKYDLWHAREFHNGDRDFIEGLIAGQVKGAQELLDLIIKYGNIELRLEC